MKEYNAMYIIRNYYNNLLLTVPQGVYSPKTRSGEDFQKKGGKKGKLWYRQKVKKKRGKKYEKWGSFSIKTSSDI